MIALVSAKGSPGVTTTALSLALTAPGQCLLAECDPAGGDILAGYLQGSLPAERGLPQLAVAQLRGRHPDELDPQLVDLDAPRRQRLLLPGVSDPAQSATVASVWDAVAEHLHRWQAAGGDAGRQVLIDCGRMTDSHFAWPVLARAELVLLVVRATLPSVSAAVPAVRALGEQRAGAGGGEPGLLVVEVGPYRPTEIARRLGTPLVASLPQDSRTAARLSFGGTVHARMPLLRSAAGLHGRLSGGKRLTSSPATEVAGV